MPLPLILGIASGLAGAGGLGTFFYGAKKSKDAKENMEAAERRHKRNIEAFEKQNIETVKSMDKLGTKELEILASFEKFSDIIEQIQNRPEFAEFSIGDMSIPEYNTEELKKVSVGAGVMLGALGGVALGTAGGVAAAGATTAAVMTFGAASTGTAIGSLSGVAATNATLAALGGGAIAAGGGGMALGTTMLGLSTAGVGLLVGGIIFSITANSLAKKADEAWRQMLKAEEEIEKIIIYLVDLKWAANKYYRIMSVVDDIYRKHLNALEAIVTINEKTDWGEFTEKERLVTENTVLLVQLLYKMCQVKLVLSSEENSETLNKINKEDIESHIKMAKTFINTNASLKKREDTSMTVEDKKCIATVAVLYYFARCDGKISEKEKAFIVNSISQFTEKINASQKTFDEIEKIENAEKMNFFELRKYLDTVDVSVLEELSSQIRKNMNVFPTQEEKKAVQEFENYASMRKDNVKSNEWWRGSGWTR